MRGIKAKRLGGTPDIDLSSWDLPSMTELITDRLDAFEATVTKALQGAVTAATETLLGGVGDHLSAAAHGALKDIFEVVQRDGFFVNYDHEHAEPLVFSITLPLGKEELFDPEWSFSLTSVVDDYIEDHETTACRNVLRRISGELRALADKIDTACK